MTWNPWKPVAIKNVEPYIPSDIENEASIYSNIWNPVNVIANKTVNANANFAGSLRPIIISWCAQVTVAPDNNNNNVFNNGTPHGLNGIILAGGQTKPISIEGDRLEWKNAQKNAKKNITSESINSIIPDLKPHCTCSVWSPLNVASRITSRHQTNIDEIIMNIPKYNIISP